MEVKYNITSILRNPINGWQEGKWHEAENHRAVACQGLVIRSELGIARTISSSFLFDAGIFLIFYRIIRTLLKPLRMPFVAQLLAGFIVGPFFGIYILKYAINRPSLFAVASVLANIGFFLQLFALGLEINLFKLTKTGKKAFILSYSSMFTSIAFCLATYFTVINGTLGVSFTSKQLPALVLENATNYLLSTASHLNDLGMSNSKLGQLASSTSMVTDMSVMSLSIIALNVIIPLVSAPRLKALVVLYYVFLFLVVRPLITYFSSFKEEGKPLKRTHFVSIIIIILLMALVGESLDQKYSPFLVALTLPEEPLGTIFAEKLDPFSSNILFPFFVLKCGMQMKISFNLGMREFALVILLAMGYIGKFLGMLISALFLRVPSKQAIALALILSARGVLDVASVESLIQTAVLDDKLYTISILNNAITMGILLPFVKFLYEPSRQYSTIMRHSVFDFQENNDMLLILVCIHKEESLPGLMRFLNVCHSTQQNPISVLVLQLLQLTGRCAMPIMAPLHEVSSIASLRSNIDRSTRIVNSFLTLERETEGRTRAQHFVAMSPYATMYNDICNLAYEKSVGLVILPFHITWGSDGMIKDSSLAIREVNNMVLQKAPCSVSLLVDRSSSRKRVIDENAYMITIVFVGGSDDYEALAYGKLFANHPCVRLSIIWLKPPKNNKDNELDCEVMKQFRRSCKNNERINFKEVVVNNGDETIQVMVSVKDDVDLIVTGKYHNAQTVPLLGLSDGWSEYPELGILGDIFASSDFEFSLLVVQQEPQTEFAMDCEEN
ncbi:cation/H(+) antiporter 14-like [Silene latifolia]|uniref:cation/H(+) antiporter 14-like n=1 Tax=Silene latifolia TaxID=37657 RepID=UPI003D7841C7